MSHFLEIGYLGSAMGYLATLFDGPVLAVIGSAIAGGLLFGARRLFWLTEKLFSPPVLVFVSTGGTCRDPMAKVIMEKLAQERGARIRVYAAGIGRGHSRTASKAAKLVVREQCGSDLLRDHRTRRLGGRLATKADLILTMEDYHVEQVKKLFPYAASKTHTVANFLGSKRAIPNPYREAGEVNQQALQRYRDSYRQLERALVLHVDKILYALGATASVRTTLPATFSDFQELLERRCRDAVDQVGRATAKIFSDAAAQNALGNSRVGLILADALELAWRELLATVQTDLRQWKDRTELDQFQLKSAAERELRDILSILIDKSRVDRSKSGLPGTEMLPSVAQRIAALPDELAFMLRQFEIGMDTNPIGSHAAARERGVDWQMWGAILSALGILVVLGLAAAGIS